MNPNHARILKKCHELEQVISKSKPKPWETWLFFDWQEETEHGPRYKVSEWFGQLPERHRVGLRRCIAALEKKGLLTTWRRWDDRLTNVKLTEAGRREAQKLTTPAE